MPDWPEGNAIVYCEGAFRSTNGKTAHGLVRRSERYRILAVIDSTSAGDDAGEVLDGTPCGIPIVGSLEAALVHAAAVGRRPTHLIVGLAPDGGRLPRHARFCLLDALEQRLHVVSGLHDFLSEDPELERAARRRGVTLTDVRMPPPREVLHSFSGKIERVPALRVAVLGTDSAVGKRTTAWLLVDALRARGRKTELVGTGQTAWMQGARYGLILDSLINDFVAGEIEHAVWRAWDEGGADTIVIEGQGSLMNPAYPGGFEILAAARPHVVVLQHAPGRRHYDGFPDHPMHPIDIQIQAIELVSGRPVVAVTLNREGLDEAGVRQACEEVRQRTGRPTFDVLGGGARELGDLVARSALEAACRS